MDLKKGTWTPEEDRKLMAYINSYGIWNWNEMPKYAGLLRSGKSCRLRWMNYLRPGIKRGNFSMEEEETIINLHTVLGNRWSEIARRISQRTDCEIKNHWNTRLKKLVKEKAISSTAPDRELDTTSSLSFKVEDYISSPESSVLNSPTTGGDHDFDVDVVSAFLNEENYANDDSSENIHGEVVDNGSIKEENADNSMEVLFQDSWEHDPMVDNFPNKIDEDMMAMMMGVPSQQMGHYEFSVLSDSYSPDDFVDYDFWSSSSI